jgi:DNA-binding IclR family transcriptional regulator
VPYQSPNSGLLSAEAGQIDYRSAIERFSLAKCAAIGHYYPMADSIESKYRAPALEKGLAVLELLAGAREPMSLNAISRQLKRSVSELFRMIQVLESHGYLEVSNSGEGYVLSNKLFALGMARAPTKDLLDVALPVMHRLTAKIGQSCHLVVASGDQMVVVARVEAPGDLGFSVRIGYRRALIASTSGLVLYAFQVDLVRTEWKSRLSASVAKSDWVKFETAGHAARKAGYVKMASHAVQGVIDLSAPIYQSGGVVAALTTPNVKTSRSLSEEETVPKIVSAANEISGELSLGNRPLNSA